MREAIQKLTLNHGIDVDYLRIRALPATPSTLEFLRTHERVYVVEQNRDAQLATILRAEHPEVATRLRSVLHYNGLPLDAATVVNQICQQEGE